MWGARTSRHSVPIDCHALERMMQADDVMAMPYTERREREY